MMEIDNEIWIDNWQLKTEDQEERQQQGQQ